MALLTPEQIARQILTLYEDGYKTVLDEVYDAWKTTEKIDLADFADRRIVAETTDRNISLFSQWPGLAIAVGDLREIPDSRSQQFSNWYELQVQLIYYIRDVEDRRLAIITMRHMEATLSFLGRNQSLGLGSQAMIQPGVRIEPSANVLPGRQGNTLTKGLRTSFRVRMMQLGF